LDKVFLPIEILKMN